MRRKTPDAPTLAEAVQAAEVEGDLRRRIAGLSRQLAEAKASKRELVEAVYQAARDGIAGLEIDRVKPPSPDKRHDTAEVAVPVLADWQLAKVTPTYSSDICEKRIGQYADKVRRLTAIQRADHPVRECHVYLMGDLVEGELIFPGQAWRIDASLYRQVTIDGPRILGNFLRAMLADFDKVHVVAVIGNHGSLGGRARKDYHPESNADRMLYRVAQQLLAHEKRLTWRIPDDDTPSDTPGRTTPERNWYAVDQIGDKRFFLFHGDQMRGGGFGGLPFYGFAKGINAWASGVIPEGFDVAICGHWHQSASIPINKRILYVAGSPESFNTYAQEELKAMSDPSQWLLFAHPRHGITAEYRVWLS